MHLSTHLKIITPVISLCILSACQDQNRFVGEISDTGEGIQKLTGTIIHQFQNNDDSGVIIALDNGCALRARIKGDSQLNIEFEPIQFACDQISNQHITHHDASIYLQSSQLKKIGKPHTDVLSVQINKRHMPLIVVETPEVLDKSIWYKTYHRG